MNALLLLTFVLRMAGPAVAGDGHGGMVAICIGTQIIYVSADGDESSPPVSVEICPWFGADTTPETERMALPTPVEAMVAVVSRPVTVAAPFARPVAGFLSRAPPILG